jgi:hypothetical protein
LTRARWRRLEVSEFLNDSLVDFALKRLQWQLAQQLSPAEYQVRLLRACGSSRMPDLLSRAAQVSLFQLLLLQEAAHQRVHHCVRFWPCMQHALLADAFMRFQVS